MTGLTVAFGWCSDGGKNDHNHHGSHIGIQSHFSSRRAFLEGILPVSGIAITTISGNASPVHAVSDDSPLFRPNPLTNRFLEQIRIWEQAESDIVKYGGELEGGDTGKRSAEQYADLLVPILRIADELERVGTLVEHNQESRTNLRLAQTILQQPVYEKVNFKRVFNAYGDNIYYTDPDRANVYLGGGATPKTEQTLAYLQRNEILTKVEDLRAELDFILRNPSESTDELRQLSREACSAMRRYLDIVPPTELRRARSQLNGALVRE